MGGFTILWNYSKFSAVDPGEAYVCAFDPATGSKSDANGWVKFAGTRRTITKQMMNPNTILPYNIPIYIVCRLSSATATTGTNYMVWYNSGWKYSAASPSAVGGAWTWTDGTDIILGKFVEPGSELDLTECEIYNPPLTAKHVSSDTVTARSANALATTANNTANAAAPKTSAVAEEQYIYIQAVSGTNSVSGTTTWVSATGESTTSDTAGLTPTWTTKRPTYRSKYPVIFVAKQKKTVSGTVTCSTPIKDDTLTIIDGGHITTGTIDASKATITNINASNITTGTLSADRIAAGAITTNKLAVTDSTNYCQLNRYTAEGFGFEVIEDSDNPNAPWFKQLTLTRIAFVSDWFDCRGGESFRVGMVVSSTVMGKASSSATATTYMQIKICINSQTADDTDNWKTFTIVTGDSDGTETHNTGVITIPANAVRFRTYVLINGVSSFSGILKVRRPTVFKMAGGDLLVDGSITSTKLATGLNNTINGKANSSSAVAEEQYIYIQAVSGTNSVSGTTTWVSATGESTTSDTAGLTPAWTTKRPTYRSKYPVIFVAKQKKTVSGTVTCSTPIKDDTTTIIDGGHITTGTIDASKATITNINASNITTGTVAAARIDAAHLTIGQSQVTNLTTDLASKANKTLPDTRNDNQPPSWYFTNYPRQRITEFKYANKIGIGSSSVYCSLETVVPWSDSSGGYPVQYATVSGVRYYRTGTAASTWSAWTQEETTSGAQTKANEAASTAESNAKNDTTNKLKSYSTTTQMNSAIGTAKSEAISAAAQDASAKVSAVQEDLESVEEIANAANSKSVSFRGVNSVAADTAAKTVACAGFALTQGYSVTVYNSTANTVAGKLTLNVNSTGAKDIYVGGAVTSDTNRLLWAAGAVITFVYDGTRFRVADNPSAWYGSTCTIAEGTAAKTTSINEIVIFKGATVTVPMNYSNSATAATLNVSSLGASSIYYGSGTTIPTKSNGYAWPAGAAVIFTYDGKFWRTGNQTFIDGGNILTGTIAADRIKANVISAVNNGTGTIDADKINASSLTIGYSQLTGTPSIPSKVTDLSDSSNYLTSSSASSTYATKTSLTDESNARKATYGTCSTNSGTQVKAVTCSNFALYTGAVVSVKFNSANTHATPQLNVNSTGAHDVKNHTGGTLTLAEYKWVSGSVVTFVYDGTYWRMQDNGTLGKASDAAKTASDYITAVDSNGIKVHAASNPTSNYTLINASGLDVYISGSSYARFGSTARIGLGSGWHANFTISGMEVLNSSTSYASFGTTARIGTPSGQRITMDSNGIKLYNASNKAIFTANDSNIRLGDTSTGYFEVDTNADKLIFKTGKSDFADFVYQFEPMIESGDGIEVMVGTRFLAGTGLSGSTNLSHGQVIFGSYNKKVSGALFIIGNGSSPSNRSNAIAVSETGVLTLGKPLTKGNGGTGVTGTTSVDLTSSGFTYSGLSNAFMDTFKIYTNGVVQSIYLAAGHLDTTLSSGSSVTLGTLASGYRPTTNYIYVYAGSSSTTFAGRLLVRIGSNGQIVLYNASGSSLSANANINFSATWAI